LSDLAIALCVSGCVMDWAGLCFFQGRIQCFLQGVLLPPPSNCVGDDTIKYVSNESSSVEHLCRAGCCTGGNLRPLPVPLRPPPRSNILDIHSIVLFVGVAELRLCRLAGAELHGAGLISFFASAGTERLPDLLMADLQWSRVRRLPIP
jgi:hypothetical protein